MKESRQEVNKEKTDNSVLLDYCIGLDNAFISNCNVAADDNTGADDDIIAKLCRIMDHGRRVYIFPFNITVVMVGICLAN